jgi:hypothetical protein
MEKEKELSIRAIAKETMITRLYLKQARVSISVFMMKKAS